MDLNDVTLHAQQIRETNKLSTENAEHLKRLRIQLKNPVLPQHTIETRAGSRPPTREEIKKFEEIESIKRGYYNISEDKIITHNWTEFCKLHQWDPKDVEPFLLLREENKTYIRSKRERKRFVQFLADGLPKRTLYSVYHRFRILYADNFQGRYRPEEDRMILDHLEHNINLDQKRKYTDLAKVLKRTRISIWRRYKLLKEKTLLKSIRNQFHGIYFTIMNFQLISDTFSRLKNFDLARFVKGNYTRCPRGHGIRLTYK